MANGHGAQAASRPCLEGRSNASRYNGKVFQKLVDAFAALDRRGAWMISYADYSWAQEGRGGMVALGGSASRISMSR